MTHLQLNSLGCGSTIPASRPLSSSWVNIDGFTFLIDAPEGVQKKLFERKCGFGLDAILITNHTVRSVLGLPGLLSTLSFHVDRSRKLTIYSPQAAVSRIRDSIDCLANIGFTVDIEPIHPEEEIKSYNKHAVRLIQNSVSDSYGIEIRIESRGEFNRSKAEQLGIPVGPKYGQLCNGESVETPEGEIVRPEQVLSDAPNTVSVVFSGRTGTSPPVADTAKSCNILIHDSLTTEQSKSSRATIEEAAAIAAEAEPEYLFLNRISCRIQHLHDSKLVGFADDAASLGAKIGVWSDGLEIKLNDDGITSVKREAPRTSDGHDINNQVEPSDEELTEFRSRGETQTTHTTGISIEDMPKKVQEIIKSK